MTAPTPGPAALRKVEQQMFTAVVTKLCEANVDCTIIATDGDRPRQCGGCPHVCVAARWEDGFLDLVCRKHGEAAEQRPGALVVWGRESR